jgi:hypothetical protein
MDTAMKKQVGSRGDNKLVGDLNEGQSNLLVPDLIRNSRNIDDALWNGSDKVPLVQRIGFIIVGLFLFICGAAMASYPNRGHYLLQAIVALAFAGAGLRVAWNGVRNSKPTLNRRKSGR